MLPDPNDRFMPHKRGGVLRAVTIVIALVAVTVFAGMIGYTYMTRGDGVPGVAPLIKADPRPMKRRPTSPAAWKCRTRTRRSTASSAARRRRSRPHGRTPAAAAGGADGAPAPARGAAAAGAADSARTPGGAAARGRRGDATDGRRRAGRPRRRRSPRRQPMSRARRRRRPQRGGIGGGRAFGRRALPRPARGVAHERGCRARVGETETRAPRSAGSARAERRARRSWRARHVLPDPGRAVRGRGGRQGALRRLSEKQSAGASLSVLKSRGAPKAAIFGCAGPSLTEQERAFFAASDPLGFILFARNVATPRSGPRCW